MIEINLAIHAFPRSLLILDKVGRLTRTYNGIYIAWAVVEYIHNHPGKMIFLSISATSDF
jgi:DNA mismatch repair ATPase MutS